MTSPNTETVADSQAGGAAFAADLPCPLCGYNLRGLTTPRCPECGFAFRWDELVGEQHGHHWYLFEHARTHRLRRLLGTYARAAVPRRFWRQVTPANPVDVRRLTIYWAAVNATLVLLALVMLGIDVVQAVHFNAQSRSAYHPIPNEPGMFAGTAFVGDRTSAHQLDLSYPTLWSRQFASNLLTETYPAAFPFVAIAAVLCALWPWLTVASLLVFRASMRQARVNREHLLRVAVYSTDCALFVLAATLLLYGPTAIIGQLAALPIDAFSPSGWVNAAGLLDHLGRDDLFGHDGTVGRYVSAGVVIALAAVVLVTYRLTFACSRYLRFAHPFATALASQVIVCLAVGIAVSRLYWWLG